MEDPGELQCVGKLEIAKPKPVGFLCGTLPVTTDATFPVFQSAIVPSSPITGAPRYQMLPTETDLNTLPLLSGCKEEVFLAATKAGEEPQWEYNPISQNLSRKCEALAVSGLAEYGDEIDVVAPSDILKQIFKIPYSKAQLSIAVHRIGDTLILNTGPDVEEGEKIFRRQSNQPKASDPSILLNFAMHSVRAEACDCPPTHHPSTEKQSSSTILPGHFGHKEGSFASSTSSRVGKAQFLDKNVSSCQKTTQANHDKYFWGTKQNKQKTKKPHSVNRASEVGEKPRCPVQDSDKFRRVGNNGFLRVLFWQFHNFRMLLGSDLLLFSNEKYVAVSLHLWDVARQVTPLTWLEAWLDNVMASVPELAICYHENGVVQGYELLKTDDIFLLKGISEDGIPAFHPQVVQQNGLSVLRFLQDNCKQDPGAYWLYKSAGEDVIQLFDLSVIPKNHSDDDRSKNHSPLPSLMHEGRRDLLFSLGTLLYLLYKSAGEDVIQLFDLSVIPKNHSDDDSNKNHSPLPSLMHKGRRDLLFSLGTLLYRVAHRLSLSKAPDNRTKCAKFFKKCLEFLHEQDHLVVRAYAHEQFARLILKCYDELELTSDSFLLESEVTVTDLKEESSEFSPGMFGSTGQDMVASEAAEDMFSTKDGTILQSLDADASELKSEADSGAVCTASEMGGLSESMASLKTHDSLEMCQMSAVPTHVVKTVADPISSKLAAVHHVSQAIKSLRWKRQLQNAQGDLVDHGIRINDRSNFSLCGCGDADCIEVCDIREWLPKSKMDHKMWNLVLLLGESYLALGEAYKEDGQFLRTLKVVELACLVYGSMPQHLKDACFISSMVGSSSCQLKVKNGKEEMDWAVDRAEGLDSLLFEEGYSADQFSPTYLFWAKAWSLVGDVYVEYYRTRHKEDPVLLERKKSGSELRMSNEVVREVQRLKKKLGQFKSNCSSCSLMNCSCQSDRASSGNSASSSGGDAASSYGRKQSRKRNSSQSLLAHTNDDSSCNVGSEQSFEFEHLQNNKNRCTYNAPPRHYSPKEIPASVDVDREGTLEIDKAGCRCASGSEPCTKGASELRSGGIFKFLGGPRLADAENKLLAAMDCYDAATKAFGSCPNGSAELHSIMKKKGWVCNELGRYRLESRNLPGAESAFIDAIKAFKVVSDHTNIILINCNLGHGRRALAEELVTKMDELKKHGIFQSAYQQAMKKAKGEYFESLRYYGAAKAELTSAGDASDHMLHSEVYTQYAHTYLRLGMLLARESISAENSESGHIDESLKSRTKEAKEERKHEISASDAFREALAMYTFLGDLRKQEASYAHFQLACYHRDACLKFMNLDQKQVKLSSNENIRQKSKWYASLADKHWQKSIDFYGPRTHPVMYLTILMEQSALSLSLSNSFHSNTMLEAALLHLLEGRHVVEENDNHKFEQDPEVGVKFWGQLQALLKTMLSALISGNSKGGAVGQLSTSSRAGDSGKLKELYRMSLTSNSLSQLHVMHRLWVN